MPTHAPTDAPNTPCSLWTARSGAVSGVLAELLKRLDRSEAELLAAIETLQVSDVAIREQAKPFRTPVTPEVMALAAQG